MLCGALAPAPAPRPRALVWAAASLTVAAVLSVGYWSARIPSPAGEWQARGGDAATIARDVGIQLYADEHGLKPLQPGAAVRGGTRLTAGYRNLGQRAVSLLLFAIDARGAVHWIAPRYLRARDDPAATELAATSGEERLLPTTVVFDDVAPGVLRVVAVITATPTHVSDIEALSASELSARDITRRLSNAEVRETLLHVIAAGDNAQ